MTNTLQTQKSPGFKLSITIQIDGLSSILGLARIAGLSTAVIALAHKIIVWISQR